MRLEVRLYAQLIIAIGVVATFIELTAVPNWGYSWTPLVGVALLSLYIVAVHFQFQIHSGWATDASTVPAVATALLLPPGIGMLMACAALLTYAIRRGRLGLKVAFNAASGMLAVGCAAHLATLFGGPSQLTSGFGWTALPAVSLASTAYYLV